MLPVLVIGVLLVALLASYPFSFLAVTAIAYLAHIPFAWRARKRAEARAAAVPADNVPAGELVSANPAGRSRNFVQKRRTDHLL